MSDLNYISFAGNGTGLIIRKYWNEDGGGVVLREEHDLTPIEIVLEPLAVPEGVPIADLFKASHIQKAKFVVPKADGRRAKEDVFDAVNCKDLVIHAGDVWPAEKYVATTKGQSERITHRIDRQHGHAREADYDYGNAVNANIPQGRTTGCILNANLVDNTKATVRVLHAHVPTFENGADKYDVDDRAKGVFGALYAFLKSLLSIFNIKI